ncbi:putative cytochrome b561 ferric reductase transmembrane protein [Zalerion maritima]|uniref:Cytochrome b561 ferric reductase transmembrane protein n=1 Tax=Zalerion maritima TaxID=339359 RepID=A0AAD5RNQ9_9PEZI|nr:putative cytochrome b561 ferric reductase transmembrane protein [Zalerion maritima]
MAPADTLSPAGSSTYNSDTISVGDGTWDFTKNTFLLPPLTGVNFETMRANGMAQRFSTILQYHKIVKAHGVLAAITFLFIVPIAVMIARFHRGPPKSYRYHAYMQIIAIGLSTAIFVLGYFAVGPHRSLTNPHHGIGVALYTLIIIQGIGGRIIKNVRGRSIRVMLHRWFGRIIALLGIIQVPLGLTLYGSPKYLFILFTLWMSFLLLVYFILSYKRDGHTDHYAHGGRSYKSEVTGTSSSSSSSGGGLMKWLGPLAAVAAITALFKRRRRNRSPSPSRSSGYTRSRSRSRGPEVLSSRRSSYRGPGSESYYTEDKYSGRTEKEKKGGFFSKLLGVGAAVGGAAVIGKMLGRKKGGSADSYSDDYSTVESDTPTKKHHHKPSVVSDYTDETEEDYRGGRRTPLLPPPVQSGMTPDRPTTPRPSHRPRPGQSAISGVDESDYSSYISASPSKHRRQSGGSVGKGLLAGLGLGWFAKRMKDRKDRQDMRYEDERRQGAYGSRFTGDGHSSPTRRPSRQYTGRPAHIPSGGASSLTYDSEFSSALEPRQPGSSHAGPPMPPYTASSGAPDESHVASPIPPPTITHVPATGAPVPPPPGSSRHSHSRSRSRHDIPPATMPPIPDDPQGILAGLYDDRESGSEDYQSPGGHPHRRGSRRHRAAAEALASASRLAQEQEDDRRRHVAPPSTAGAPSAPVSVSVKMHQDRGRSVTLRQLTEDERERKSAREARRKVRADSVSSLSGATDSAVGSNRRYRRESRDRRGSVSEDSELHPPAPPFAGRRTKDSAYYSAGGAAAGPSSAPPPSSQAPAPGAAVSSVGSPGTGSYWSPAQSNAIEKRKRRRADRRKQSGGHTVDFS